jgi:hypothetical protein
MSKPKPTGDIEGDYEHNEIECPFCDYEMDHSASIGEESAPPSAGDVSICINCSAVTLYEEDGDGLRLRAFTSQEEADAVLSDPEVQKAVRAVRRLMKQR